MSKISLQASLTVRQQEEVSECGVRLGQLIVSSVVSHNQGGEGVMCCH